MAKKHSKQTLLPYEKIITQSQKLNLSMTLATCFHVLYLRNKDVKPEIY